VDVKGRLVANVFDKEHRVYVPYNEIPGRLIETLVATEDTAFFEHEGVSFEAIARAIIKDVIAGRAAEGASTITQQLVKTTLLTSEKRLTRKIKEAVIAMRIEQLLTKEQILERYFNHIYFGHGYYGIKTAAMGYFHKNLNELTLKEMAMLIGLPKAPSVYDPTKNLQMSLARANSIVYRMKNLGWIDDATVQSSIALIPTVYNETLTVNKAPHAVDAALKALEKQYPDIRGGGYKVELTIDLDLQNMAETALRNQYTKILGQVSKKADVSQLNGALVSMDQTTGDVLAMVGGVDYNRSFFNRATQSRRQAGSSFKPFVYLAAFDAGLTPDTVVDDTPKSYTFVVNGVKKVWEPKNYEKDFKGVVTMRNALVHSRNLATLSVVERIGMNVLYPKLESFGFTNLQRNMSIALGSLSFSPLQMAEYYTIISNYGTRVTPRIVKSVTPRGGKAVEFTVTRFTVQDPLKVYPLIDVMKDVVARGTGTPARVEGIEVAGKTGTTDEYKDAWFCGFTPNTQTIVWFGNDNNKPLPGKFTGGIIAAPVFAEYTRNMILARPTMKRTFVTITQPIEPNQDGNGTKVVENNESIVDKLLSHF
jgi:penicillin-binding protein 1A